MFLVASSMTQTPPKSEDKFEYVVERKEQQKICFGSTKTREFSAINERYLKQFKAGPCTYNIKSGVFQLLNKVRSRKGVPGLANRAPRFDTKVLEPTPSPTRYDTFLKRPGKGDGAAPFGYKSKRIMLRFNKLPGPGTYDHKTWKCRRTRFDANFGRPIMIPTIEEICIPVPVDTCSKCGDVCEGCYWQQNHTVYLCHSCMVEEIKLHEMYKKAQLKSFVQMRNCSYRHRHEGTTAAIRLLSQWKIDRKRRMENYLDLYIKC